MQQLWEALPSWEQQESEVLMGGHVVVEWGKAQALDKLVPQEQLSVIEQASSRKKWAETTPK